VLYSETKVTTRQSVKKVAQQLLYSAMNMGQQCIHQDTKYSSVQSRFCQFK
jgi:hypothetical protein